jgi:hypothetical protein
MILLLLLLLLYETAAQSRHLNLRTEGIEELPEIRPPCRDFYGISGVSTVFCWEKNLPWDSNNKIHEHFQYISQLLSILPQLYIV